MSGAADTCRHTSDLIDRVLERKHPSADLDDQRLCLPGVFDGYCLFSLAARVHQLDQLTVHGLRHVLGSRNDYNSMGLAV